MSKSLATNHLGKISLASCRKIKIKNLQESLDTFTMKLMQDLFPKAKIVSKPCNFGGERYLFLCPKCQKNVFTLYEDPFSGIISCHRCTGYTYPRQRFKGMIEEEF